MKNEIFLILIENTKVTKNGDRIIPQAKLKPLANQITELLKNIKS